MDFRFFCMIHHSNPHWRLLERKKISNKMFQCGWVCAVKCTIDCAPIHMGQIPQDEILTKMVLLKKKVEPSCDQTFIFQLFLPNCISWTLETVYRFTLEFLGVPCNTSILALLSHFWVVFIGPRCPWGPIYGSGCL